MERGVTPPTNQELLRLATEACYDGSNLEGSRGFLLRELARRGLVTMLGNNQSDTTGFYDAAPDIYHNPSEAYQYWLMPTEPLQGDNH